LCGGGRRSLRDPRNQKERIFFSEEKKQKTFGALSRTRRKRTPKRQKFFASFFQKRRFFLRSCAHRRPYTIGGNSTLSRCPRILFHAIAQPFRRRNPYQKRLARHLLVQ
jgi:hypothetical protein